MNQLELTLDIEEPIPESEELTYSDPEDKNKKREKEKDNQVSFEVDFFI